MHNYGRDYLVIPDGLQHAGCVYIDPLEPGKHCYRIVSGKNKYLVNSNFDGILEFEKWFFEEYKLIPIITDRVNQVKPPEVRVTIWSNFITDEKIVFDELVELRDLQRLHSFCLSYIEYGVRNFYLASTGQYQNGQNFYYTAQFKVGEDHIAERYFYDWLVEIVY